MRCGSEVTWQRLTWLTCGASGAGDTDTWQEAMRVHEDAREGRHVASEEVGRWRAHGLVGLGYRIGAVTHLHYAPPPYILAKSACFLSVGLCSRGFSFCK